MFTSKYEYEVLVSLWLIKPLSRYGVLVLSPATLRPLLDFLEEFGCVYYRALNEVHCNSVHCIALRR